MLENRRQLRVARIIKEVVSDAIRNHLSDPRIQGLISVTEVEMSDDTRNANVHLSLLPAETSVATLRAIKHARGHIQTLLANELDMRFCPIIEFTEDTKYKKAGETLKLIEQISNEMNAHDNDAACEEID